MRLFVGSLFLCASAASAQVTVSIQTINEGVVGSTLAGGFYEIPAGVDVSNGAQRSAFGTDFDLSVTTTPSLVQIVTTCDSSYVSFGCTAAYTRAELEITLTSPTEIPVDLIADAALLPAALDFEIVSTGQVFTNSTSAVPLTIGPSGTVLRVDLRAIDTSCPPLGASGVSALGILDLRVVPGSFGHTFGSDCGATLDSRGNDDLTTPTLETVSVDGPLGHSVAVLYLGLDETQLPTPFGCDLLVTPILAAVPIALDALGDLSFSFAPPTNLFTLQAATSDGVSVAFTNGLTLDPLRAIPPRILDIRPPSAVIGAPITVDGTGFDTMATLMIDDISVSPIILNANTAVFLVPPGVDCDSVFTITNPSGRSASAAYNPTPTITSAPLTIGAAGGDLQVDGTSIPIGTTVTIGGTPAFVGFSSGTSVFFRAPAGTPGTTLPVVVTTPGGCSASTTLTYL